MGHENTRKGKQTIKCKYFSEQMDRMSQCEWSLILGNKKIKQKPSLFNLSGFSEFKKGLASKFQIFRKVWDFQNFFKKSEKHWDTST